MNEPAMRHGAPASGAPASGPRASGEAASGAPLSGAPGQGAAEPLRILCLNYEYPPMGGGAGNATRHTAAALAARGHDVHVLTARSPGQPAREVVDGVVVWRVRSFRRSLLECGLAGAASYLVFAFLRLIRLAPAQRYDVYQFYFSLPTGLLALYVHWVLRKPYVLALRGSDVPGYDDTKWYMRPLHRLCRPLTRYLWRNASAVTVLSEALQRLARETAPDVDSVVIPNGVDSELFTPSRVRSRDTRIRLLTVCRMVRRKGLEHLIEAMRELEAHGVELELVGSGQEQDRVRELVRAYALEGCISMPGYVPREALPEHYRQADIFVLPSLRESLGQVLLEAMSCGLPVVATTVGGIPETVHHNRGGLLVPPADPHAIVNAVRELADHPERRARMARYNAEHVRARFGWDCVAGEYEALYSSVCVSTTLRESRQRHAYEALRRQSGA